MEGKKLENNIKVVKLICSTKLINISLKRSGVISNLTRRSTLGHEAEVLKAYEKNSAVLFSDKFLAPRIFSSVH